MSTGAILHASISALQEVCSCHLIKLQNADLQQETRQLMSIVYVKTKQLQHRAAAQGITSVATLEELARHFEHAAYQLGSIMANPRWWHRDNLVEAPYVKDELAKLATRLNQQIQIALFFASLETSIDIHAHQSSFAPWIANLMVHVGQQNAESTAAVQQRITQLKSVFGNRFGASVEACKAAAEAVDRSDPDTHKLIDDVLRQVCAMATEATPSTSVATSATADDNNPLLQDPITMETMCDPVNCSDGYVYDRFTVLGMRDGKRLAKSPYTGQELLIRDDNHHLRSALSYAQDQLRAQKRALFRERSLEDATSCLEAQQWNLQDMRQRQQLQDILQDLKAVLVWDAQDAHCLAMCDRMERLLLSAMFAREDYVVFTPMHPQHRHLVDVPGNPRIGTLQEAMLACASTPGCVGFSWPKSAAGDAQVGEYWLKRSLGSKSYCDSTWCTYVRV